MSGVEGFVVTKMRLYPSSFFQAEDGIRDSPVTGVQTCALPIYGIAAMVMISEYVVSGQEVHKDLPQRVAFHGH